MSRILDALWRSPRLARARQLARGARNEAELDVALDEARAAAVEAAEQLRIAIERGELTREELDEELAQQYRHGYL
jgi:uncharacterized protein YaaN involved in tellurite resistance